MLKNGLYNLIGTVSLLAISILTIPLLIRFLGVETYGLWALVSSTLVLIGLADGGLSASTTFFVSRDLGQGNSDELISSLLTIGVAMLALSFFALLFLFFSAPLIASNFPNLTEEQRFLIGNALRWGSIAVSFRMFQGFFSGIEQAYDAYAFKNGANTLHGLFSKIGLVFLAWKGIDIIGLMQWQAVTGGGVLCIHFLISTKFVRKSCETEKVTVKWSWSKVAKVFKYSGAIWLTTLSNVLFSQCDKILVGALLDPRALGFYAAITQIAAQINSVSATIVQPLLPKVSRIALTEREGSKKLVKELTEAAKINASVAYGLGGTLLALLPIVGKLIFSSEYYSDEIKFSLALAIIIYSIYSVNAFAYYALMGLNKERVLMRVVLLSSFTSISLIGIGAYNFGLVGAVFGNIGFVGVLVLSVAAAQTIQLHIGYFFERIWTDSVIFSAVCLVSILAPPGTPLAYRFLLALLQCIWASKIFWNYALRFYQRLKIHQ